jgi:UDP-N-acetylmuramoyl-L-alanyl-D-glutamate--2,6-diaminopimelate ligase
MLLSSIIRESGSQPAEAGGEADITSIQIDSRAVTPGALFVCMPSKNSDSHSFIPDAIAKGAVAVFAHTREGFESALKQGVAAVWAPWSADTGSADFSRNHPWHFQETVARFAKTITGNPTAKMKVIGVTGTNGKTTTAWLLRDMLRSVGRKPAYIGTLGIHTPKSERELNNTTPMAVELYNLIAEAAADGADSLCMEVSSHALFERRSEFLEFDAGVFTNLTQDHLDFHGSMEEYEAAKLRLFTDLPKQTSKRFVSVINSDDPVGARWLNQISTEKLSYGLSSGDLRAEALEVKVDRVKLTLTHGFDRVVAEAPLGGTYNVWNCLSAVAGFMGLGFTLAESAEALAHVRAVPGRFEAVPNDRGIGILVDYAHTPDALEKLLEAVRKLGPRRLITVFGCGGDRDRNKRPKMARVTSSLSDLAVLTSDNPRTEDPQSILDEVATGLVEGKDSVKIIDRREAIAHAVGVAEPGDIVVIAGKGHENYQIIGRTKHPMDDRELAKDALGVLA